MIRTFIVKNFRCFNTLRLGTPEEPLARVNLIAGKNNTGKTALLEAIHLHCNPGNSQVPFRINDFRGFGDMPPYAPELASWLFPERQHDVNARLETISYDEQGIDRSLSLMLLPASELRRSFPELDKRLQEAFIPEIWQPETLRLVVKFEQGGQTTHSVVILAGAGKDTGSGFSALESKMPWDMSSWFLGGNALSQDAALYSELEIVNRQADLLPTLQLLEPRLKRLALALFAGKPVIHGDIGMARMIPLPLMGEGIRRLLSFLLVLTHAKGRVVLIDEIENGLHHSVVREVWRAIGDLSLRENVQVFATTHSYECIQAAHDAFEPQSDEEFRFLRLDRERDSIRVVPWMRENVETALEMNLEMR